MPKMHNTFLDGSNLWLLKPTELNRGRGISIFNKLSTFKTLMNGYQQCEEITTVKSSGEIAGLKKIYGGTTQKIQHNFQVK
jgi:hypothetical protein